MGKSKSDIYSCQCIIAKVLWAFYDSTCHSTLWKRYKIRGHWCCCIETESAITPLLLHTHTQTWNGGQKYKNPHIIYSGFFCAFEQELELRPSIGSLEINICPNSKKENLIKLLHRVVNRFVNCNGKTLVKLQDRCCCSSSRRKEVILIFYCSFGWCRWHSQLWGSGQLHQNWYLSLVASHIMCTFKVASPFCTWKIAS